MRAVMKIETTKPVDVFRFAAGCVAVSFVGAVVHLLFSQIPDVRAVAGACGFGASLLASGVSFWFALRSKESKLFAMAFLSVCLLGFWCWVLYKVVHGI